MSEKEWIARQITIYRQQEREEEDLLLALGNDHSLENIRRVIRNRLYKEQANVREENQAKDSL